MEQDELKEGVGGHVNQGDRPYHQGEIALQERSGGRRTAQEFLQQLPFVVLGAADETW